MNQILVSEKLYVTPELKKKKKAYKFNFFLSIFLVCMFISCYIYAEYDRNKSEEVSQEILSDLNIVDDTMIKDNILVVVLDDNEEDIDIEQVKEEVISKNTKTVNGYSYSTIGTVKIPKINVEYPILSGVTGTEDEMEALLKVSICKFWGANPNEVGNFCLVGHNYRNNKFFSKVPTLSVGDIVEITDLSGKTIKYEIYDKYTVEPDNTNCTTQLTNGKKEVTLITCTDNSKQRVIVKAKEKK